MDYRQQMKWFPFKSKEGMCMSCPNWNTLNYACLWVWQIWTSPIGMAYMHLDYEFTNLSKWKLILRREELANCIVNPHLYFYPEYTHGKIQMVEANNKHWDIFEPEELKSRHIVVPIIFFIESNQLQARWICANLFNNGPC
ncbi:hypothetical protein VP01_1961g5 [Puccinia sorghi]|uniref:Uncharacterized protein n=1 Tax=Puccinia sorghi TaxID=27349 RepID=A0A0L6VCG7_9BASI|nr:hypothetical protein VP01_1961g5 [Puccinia sorghi]